MNCINKIDDSLNKINEDLKNIICHYDFKENLLFQLNPNVNLVKFQELNFPGIYLFEIKNENKIPFHIWYHNFENLWRHEDFEKKFVPNTKKKRVDKFTTEYAYEWIPIYLGKSKCIAKRIKEHMDLDLERPTSALKLLSRKNLFGLYFRVSSIRINVKNYDVIVPKFENAFRDKINPILGRQ